MKNCFFVIEIKYGSIQHSHAPAYIEGIQWFENASETKTVSSVLDAKRFGSKKQAKQYAKGLFIRPKYDKLKIVLVDTNGNSINCRYVR